MLKEFQKYPCILAIAPSVAGFGFAVLEGSETLVDWGVKRAEGEKNRQCLLKVKGLITDVQPSVIVLEDILVKDSRRGPRTRSLTKQIVALALGNKVNVKMFTKEQIRKAFFADGQGTKHALAEIVVQRFPEELMHYLPPKRPVGDGESSRMAIFDAVALALMVYEGILNRINVSCELLNGVNHMNQSKRQSEAN